MQFNQIMYGLFVAFGSITHISHDLMTIMTAEYWIEINEIETLWGL